jgi:hypothetical protein
LLVALVTVSGLFAIAPGEATESIGPTGRTDSSLMLPAPGVFRSLRVCGSASFSRARHRCTSDQRAAPIVSNRISCSVDVVVHRTSVVRGRILYRGGVAQTIGPTILRPGTHPTWIYENVKIDQPLPGGSWRCEFTLGSARTGVGFTSGGPEGDVVNAAVCGRGKTVRHATSGLTLCRKDDSTASLPASEPVRCSGTFAGVPGKAALLEIVRHGVRRTSVDFVVGSTIWLGTVQLRPAAGSALQPGAFACRFSLDGEVVMEKPFRVVG